MPRPPVPKTATVSPARNLAFFNDRLLWTRPDAPDDTVLPHWLFILGGPDWDIQLMFEGEAFVDVMARKLIETRAAGRVQSNLDQVEENDDERMTAIAKLAYKRGEYGYAFFD